jgi:pyruvate formate-lyase/glycerol dehydratase family glycyl radical enzyme
MRELGGVETVCSRRAIMKSDNRMKVTFDDLSLECLKLTERVKQQREIYFRAMPEICTERACLITRYHLKKNGQNECLFDQFKRNGKISILDKAKAYRYVLENRAPIVTHGSAYEKGEKGMKPFQFKEAPLFAGSTTTKFKGVPLYPEFLALTLWPELSTISNRKMNPYHITAAEVEELNLRVFPHWLDFTITEILRKEHFSTNQRRSKVIEQAPQLDSMELLERLVFFLVSKGECISHTIPDFTRVLKLGLRGMIQEADQAGAQAVEDDQKQFYSAISEVLEGIIAYSKNLAREAEALALKESDSRLRKELREIARIHYKLTEYPAETFREGLTTVWICWIAIHIENPNVALSLGRLDQILYGLYEDDINHDRLDVQGALELICSLWLKIGDHVPFIPDVAEQLFGGTGSNQAITIGGVDQEGKDAVSDLTYLMLKATELMKLRDPNLNARYYPGVNSRDYLRRLCEANLNTGATPAIHNDRAVIEALKWHGDKEAQARDYGIIGCVEPGSNGRSYGASAAILLNLTSALELALFNGKHRHTGTDENSPRIGLPTGDARNPETFREFEDFWAAFEAQTRFLVQQATELNNLFGEVHQRFYPTPILSAFFEGPMEKGKDLIEGGAQINSSGATIIGLADVVDSLSAIQEVVFDEGKKNPGSFAKLLDALEDNFEHDEKLQKRLANPDKTPKYGNEHPDADLNACRVVGLLDEVFAEKENYRGGHYRVGYWTMTNHAGFGRLMKAMPNGRKAWENFTSGITPVSGVTPHLTQTLNSVAKLPAKCLSSGVALNLKYTPTDEDRVRMLDNFAASVEGYFDSRGAGSEGGMEIQFNIIDHKTLEDAFHNPEKYPELLVRVSGYTAYFKDLNPQMKKEVIDRTEYLLSTGDMQLYEPFQLAKER